jgi:NAD(P)-dependent dehydrogenase (short-subunit alcohol dehydrogenase family)
MPAPAPRSETGFCNSWRSRLSFGKFLAPRRVPLLVFPAYAATKGAIDTLVKHFASTLGARGIRVNAVAPKLAFEGCLLARQRLHK